MKMLASIDAKNAYSFKIVLLQIFFPLLIILPSCFFQISVNSVNSSMFSDAELLPYILIAGIFLIIPIPSINIIDDMSNINYLTKSKKLLYKAFFTVSIPNSILFCTLKWESHAAIIICLIHFQLIVTLQSVLSYQTKYDNQNSLMCEFTINLLTSIAILLSCLSFFSDESSNILGVISASIIFSSLLVYGLYHSKITPLEKLYKEPFKNIFIILNCCPVIILLTVFLFIRCMWCFQIQHAYHLKLLNSLITLTAFMLCILHERNTRHQLLNLMVKICVILSLYNILFFISLLFIIIYNIFHYDLIVSLYIYDIFFMLINIYVFIFI